MPIGMYNLIIFTLQMQSARNPIRKNNSHRTFYPLSEKGFSAFFHKYYSSLCFFANHLIGDPQEAEDIVGEVAINIWEKRATIKHVEALKTYFYVSIRNTCIRFLQNKERRAKKKDLTDDYILQGRTILEGIIHSETLRQIEEALNSLPPQCRKVFTKLYIEGKTVSQAANELQLGLSTVKAHKQRGLIILRKKLTSLWVIAILFFL